MSKLETRYQLKGIEQLSAEAQMRWVEQVELTERYKVRWRNVGSIVGTVCFTAFVCTCMVVNCG